MNMATVGAPPSQTASSLQSDVATYEHDEANCDCDDGLSAFASVRARLYGIAYRTLRSAAEAEDIVQDVWLRWQFTNRKLVVNPAAFLAVTTMRLCINLAQSAQSRRETYIGTWLLEPVDASSDPALVAEREEGLKLAVVVLLQKLSPTERAAFVLREAFDYSYRQIANILQMAEANVRQLVCRARKHITNGQCSSVSSGEQRRFLEAFNDAAQKEDLVGLEALFVEDIASRSDSSGLVRAAQVPVSGRKRVSTFLAAAVS